MASLTTGPDAADADAASIIYRGKRWDDSSQRTDNTTIYSYWRIGHYTPLSHYHRLWPDDIEIHQ